MYKNFSVPGRHRQLVILLRDTGPALASCSLSPQQLSHLNLLFLFFPDGISLLPEYLCILDLFFALKIIKSIGISIHEHEQHDGTCLFCSSLTALLPKFMDATFPMAAPFFLNRLSLLGSSGGGVRTRLAPRSANLNHKYKFRQCVNLTIECDVIR